jgi:two-component system, NtrC family, sensor histidine kinase HydH
MSEIQQDRATDAILARAAARFEKWLDEHRVATDRVFARVLVAQWLFGIVIALTFSPYTWRGKTPSIHAHVWLATLLGGAIISLPLLLVRVRPGWAGTRHVVALAQMLASALLIHLTGGRIETHFHVFVSLALIAFYLDWRVLITATLTVVADHLALGLFLPESVYGVSNPEWWRFLEHAFWVVCLIAVLLYTCASTIKTWLGFSQEVVLLEALAERQLDASPGAGKS